MYSMASQFQEGEIPWFIYLFIYGHVLLPPLHLVQHINTAFIYLYITPHCNEEMVSMLYIFSVHIPDGAHYRVPPDGVQL
jgi:hypothetical protein